MTCRPKTFVCPASPKERMPRPVPVEGATWQAGVTPGNASLRVFIDGEPAPLVFAANPAEGWALSFIVRNDSYGDFLRGTRRLTGRVELMPIKDE
jgi:hypothetical protein